MKGIDHNARAEILYAARTAERLASALYTDNEAVIDLQDAVKQLACAVALIVDALAEETP